jgi:hypothetical protein
MVPTFSMLFNQEKKQNTPSRQIVGLFHEKKITGLGSWPIGESKECIICGCAQHIESLINGACSYSCQYEVDFYQKNKDILNLLGIQPNDFLNCPETVIETIYNYIEYHENKDLIKPEDYSKVLHKKIKFASKINYTSYKSYSDGSESHSGMPHGATYGYILKDPFTELEVSKFEATINAKLPEELRYYLINISREILIYSYPVTFELERPSSKWISKVLPMSNYQSRYEHNSDYKCSDPKKCKEESHLIYYDDYGLFYIGDGGCEFGAYISMNGVVYFSDSDSFMRRSESFLELAL